MPPNVTLYGVQGLPDIKPGDNLAKLLVDASNAQGTPFDGGDILVITQKVISKSEGQIVNLKDIIPSEFAVHYAALWDKDARLIELILREAVRVVRMENGIIITETRHGFRCANSGIDGSNVGPEREETVTLLPKDSDNSAREMRENIKSLTGKEIAVIISDTFGRPWREGASNVAIGVSGIAVLRDYRGEKDNYGRELQTTTIAIVDELAAASELVTNKLEKIPAAIIRGYPYEERDDGISPLVRSREMDLFR